MDETVTPLKPQHNPTLMRFYAWVEQWRNRRLLSNQDKDHLVMRNLWEKQPDDSDSAF